MRAIAIAAVAAAGVALTNNGTASAGIDGSSSIVDGNGVRIEAQTVDTNISFVPPLDGNPLSREFFHSGRAGFVAADNFDGTITIGYQIGFPATGSGRVYFKAQTPELEVDFGNNFGTPRAALLLSHLIPVAGFEVGASFGPGIVSVDVASGSIKGGSGTIAIGGIHGTVTGVLGQTSIRPYVKVVSSHGDTVVTYGPIFRN
ncbi:porin [Nocardiaceae bacterium YC2-7]|uniref:Porin n=1 Tax=Antrihabitans stalactiti TaxID=2584121 RepID=A0A848KIX7_9NOCA|nr:porin [Antrihabitans stalactiti]